ncbi:MAG: efflux RND transporter periplasmic adaptor subunit [Polyangiales bacterium]
MAKKLILTLIGLILVVGALVGAKVMQFQTMMAASAQGAAPPETVATSEVKETTLQPTLDAVGSVTPVQGVTLNAEVAGTIQKIAFESGAQVHEGAVLVELDTAVERAQLQAAEASSELAKVNLDSGQRLVEGGAMPKNQFSSLQAQAKQADADVARLKAIISKKTIRAPFAGRTGLRQVNLGQLVGNGDSIVSLQSLDPVYVDFGLPQQRLSQLTIGATVNVSTDVFPDQAFEGQLSAIHPEVDPTTRSIRLRATLKNPEGRLRPGMFTQVRLALPNVERALLVPATAISYAPYGDSVFTIDNKDPKSPKAQQKFVRLGEARGDFVVVLQGLTAGETVVTTGNFKLRNGMGVVINNALKPEPSLTPKPTDT